MATYTVSTASELQNRTATASPGDEIVARGGTYDMNSRWTVRNGGSDGNPIVIRAASGEIPKINFNTSGSDSGIQFRDPYVHFIGFEVANSSWKGVNTDGNAHDVVLERLDVHDSRIWGIMNNGCDNVVFRNCDSHHNTGNNENADGFNMTGPATNGLIEGCRSWANGDDGYDFWVSENHLIRDCWAWDNGRGSDGDGNGFKLGGGPNNGGKHRVERCVSFNNANRGFDWNTTDNPLEVVNCTAVDNSPNFRFSEDGPYTLQNNIAVGGVGSIAGGVDDQNNSWNMGMDDVAFRSRDPGSDDFLRLPSDSECINAGVDIGVDYDGDAPDLGAFEYDGGDSGGSTSDTSSDRTALDGETVILAEDASTTNVLYGTEHSGYNGENYANFASDSGADAALVWPVEVPSETTYNYQVRFANGGDGDRTANMTFAGDSQQITFPQTGGWATWETMSGTVALPSGEVDLGIETTGQDAGNVDRITLWPVQEADAGDTTTESSGDTPNHGLNTPEQGTENWHEPLNANFETIDRAVPIVGQDGARDEYTPAESALYIAVNTGTVYVGDGSNWNELGSFI